MLSFHLEAVWPTGIGADSIQSGGTPGEDIISFRVQNQL